MTVDAGDGGVGRRQVDVIVGVDVGHVGRGEYMIAMRTGGQCRLDDPVGMLGQRARHAGAAGAGLLGAIRQVGFLAFGRRQTGIVGILGGQNEFGLQLGDAGGQYGDLLRLRLYHSDQVITGQG